MALYDIAQQTKRTINLGIVFIILLIIFRISWNIGIYIYNTEINPPRLPAPEVCYGRLPKLELTSLPLEEDSSPTYSLDTLTGKFPILPDRAPVYKLREPLPAISVERNAENFARNLGFLSPRKEESSIDWLWEDKVLGRSLKMNIITRDFKLETDLKRITATIPEGSTPKKIDALETAENFLKQHNLLTDYLTTETQLLKYLRIHGTGIRQATEIGEAQMVEVNFSVHLPAFEEDFPGFNADNLPDFFPLMEERPDTGTIQIYVTASPAANYKIPQAYYKSILIDEKDRCTYPLKTISSAWEQLTSGQANISYLRLIDSDPYVNYTPLNINEIQIKEMALVHFESKTSPKYLLPIFIFEGEAKTEKNERARYVAYIPALDPRCLGEKDEIGTPCSN